jgi:hypothetical protein
MADYPLAHRIHMSSTIAYDDPIMVSTSLAGDTRARRWASGQKREMKIVHHGLSDSERTSLEAFLAAERRNVFALRWPHGNVPINVIWTDSAITWVDEGGKRSATTITVREV